MGVSAYDAYNVAYVQLGAANVDSREVVQVIVSATVSRAGRGRGGAAGFELDVNGTPANIFFCYIASWLVCSTCWVLLVCCLRPLLD